MRLQLILALVAVSSTARAEGGAETVEDSETGEGQVEGSMALYADDDRTTVVTSIVNGRVRLPVPAIIETHVLVDAVSSASVDVISAATPIAFDEDRIELGASARTRAFDTDGSIGYTTSGENDWRSHAVELGLSRELAKKNATVSLGYGFTRNRVGRASDPNFERRLDVHAGQLGISQVIDRNTLATLSYTAQYLTGYQASPYRFIMSPDGVSSPETPPEKRIRHAITARALRAFGRGTTIEGQYRFYVDDWGVMSHTVEASYTRELTEEHELELRLRARGYSQGHAAFYHPTYETVSKHMTADRELSTFWDVGGGARLGWYGEKWDFDIKVDGIYYHFIDYPRLAGRVALVAGLGVAWRW